MNKTPEDLLLEALSRPDYVPARVDDLVDGLGLDKKDVRYLLKSIPRMLGSGTIVRIKGDRIALPSTADLVPGVILFRAGGSARLIPDAKPDADPKGPRPEPIHIHAEDTGIALHGDKVVLRLSSETRRAKPGQSSQTGRVIRILSRANETMPGTLKKTRLFWYVVPDDPRIARDLLVPEPEKSGIFPLPKENDKVVVRLGEWEQRHLNPVGEIIEVLGETHTPMAEYKAILRKYHLNPEFPAEVMQEVAALPLTVPASDTEGRRDFRNVLTLTIDPDDAKDFDDALSVEFLDDGNIRVGIHIADVSAYVRPGSALDKNARERGNSTYLVGTVVPMLPHALSSGLCSLVEGEDRLTKAIVVTFDREARIVATEAMNTVIRSRKRLTYKQAYGMMKNSDLAVIRTLPSPPKHHSGSPGRTLSTLDDAELLEIRHAITGLWSIASKLRAARFRKGALELDMAETKIYCDAEGYAERAELIENDESHQLVEEFMLCANETVAKILREAGIAHLSRVHDQPDADKLSDLRQELAGGGIKVGDLNKREEVVKLLKIIKGMENGLPLRIRFLRSLKQACYRASADGHYGLAKEDYSHFTSPIRRYADLIEHRVFDFHLQRRHADTAPRYKVTQYPPEDLNRIADHISITERNSSEAERDSVKVKIMELFELETGRTEKAVFDAVITDVRNHGFNVELVVSQAYGLVHLSTLTDDFYVLNHEGDALIGRRTKREYRSGDKVKVVVDRVDRFKRMLDFRLVVTPQEKRETAPDHRPARDSRPARDDHRPHASGPSKGNRFEKSGDNRRTGEVSYGKSRRPSWKDREAAKFSGNRPARNDAPRRSSEKPAAPEAAPAKSGVIGRLVSKIKKLAGGGSAAPEASKVSGYTGKSVKNSGPLKPRASDGAKSGKGRSGPKDSEGERSGRVERKGRRR